MSRVEELAHPCYIVVSKRNRDPIYDAKRPYHHGLWLLKHTISAASEPSQRAQNFTARHFDSDQFDYNQLVCRQRCRQSMGLSSKDFGKKVVGTRSWQKRR